MHRRVNQRQATEFHLHYCIPVFCRDPFDDGALATLPSDHLLLLHVSHVTLACASDSLRFPTVYQMASEQGLPFLTAPHDSIRQGLPSLKEDIGSKHPVEVVQTSHKQHAELSRLNMLRDLYGVATPAKQQIERSILERFQRLPGLPSSKLGLESLTGSLDDFTFDSFLGLPHDSDTVGPPLYSQMEAKLRLQTEVFTRGIM
jgi:proteasome maturation protein